MALNAPPRERLDSAGMLAAFEQARRTGDRVAMRIILERSGFRLLEIEPISARRANSARRSPPSHGEIAS